MTLAEQAIYRAKQSIGVRETSPNWSVWIKIYLAFCNIFAPAAWCAAFVAYKVHQAAGDVGVKSVWPRQAYVQSVVNWAKRQPMGSIREAPLPNSVFVRYYADLKRYAHMGFIEKVRTNNGRTEILTIEGNSNTDGGREGHSVASTWRPWTSNHRCIRIV